MKTREILDRHDKFLDSLVDGFEDMLDPLIASARKRTLAALEKKLKVSAGGAIEFTPKNQRALRSVDRMFRTEMNRPTKDFPGGYKAIAGAFADQFADHLPKFQAVLNEITESLDGPPLPPVKFTSTDIDLFSSQAIGAKDMLLDVLDQTSNAAKRQALFSVGGLKFSDLATELAEQFEKTQASAVTIADTSVSMFYRTIASQSYKKIESSLKTGVLRFEYAGPNDSITRPFCERMLDKTRQTPMTRAQIDAQDNGQGLPVFTACGGFNCRHQFILAPSKEGSADA